MSDILLTYASGTGDLDTSEHAITIGSEIDAIDQQIQIRLRTFLNEWFLDTRVGIPYFRDILIKAPNLGVIENIYRDAILSTPGVVTVDYITAEINAAQRTLNLTFKATVDSGEELAYEPFIIFI